MNNPRQIIIDDEDPIIQYTGSWYLDKGRKDVGNFGQPFLGGQHALKTTDATVTVPFKGSTVQVFGSSDGPADDPKLSWGCFVDGNWIGAVGRTQYSQNNWVLCEALNLVDGDHQLVIKIRNEQRTFWLDYIAYTPSPNTASDSAITKVFYTDPAFQYDSFWTNVGPYAKLTAETGSVASFNFTGKGFQWYGWTLSEWSPDPSTATYSVDGGPPVPFVLKGRGPGQEPTLYNVLFFSVTDLSNGPHHLSVVYTGRHDQTAFTLTHAMIFKDPISTRAGTIPSSNPTTTSNLALPPASTLGPTTPQANLVNNKVNPSAVAAGVIGGVAFALGLSGLLLYWWRRRQRSPAPPFETAGTVTPYVRYAQVADAPFSPNRYGEAPRSPSSVSNGSQYRDENAANVSGWNARDMVSQQRGPA